MANGKFPPGFLWGSSSAAYQIEGGAGEGGRGPSIWDRHCRIAGKTPNGETGDVAADHFHRWAEDIGLMTEIGLQAYRFSVAWPRVMPRGRGAVNPEGLDFYERLVDGLLAAGIEPWLCLYHWDLPLALNDLGGWANRDSAGWFADYVTVVARRLGDRVRHFATFNEQSVSTIFGYAYGGNAPMVADYPTYLKAVHHQNLAHGAAVDVVRAHVPGASIGVVHNRQPCHPETDTAENRAATATFSTHWNEVFPDPQVLGHYPAAVAGDFEPYVQAGDLARICRPLDWFGLNHYGPMFIRAEPNPLKCGFGANPPEDPPHPDVGWAIYPQAFRQELHDTADRYRLPIYVTENGCGNWEETVAADGRVVDKHRLSFLAAYTDAMAQAIADGVDVRGYFVWSLMDCFEWGSGYGNRFGVIYVDYADQQRRILKESAKWYAGLIRG
ncbi:MAG: beta-glucosidase [Magnetospirillum sp.]|nr:beta-glucosidase [Magnetospirillum sp.]